MHVREILQLWRKLHDCIRTNDLEQLMTLLSQHRILHSAAKSNDVKMIEYVLQRLSPRTRELMKKKKNTQGQLPADLVRICTIHTFTVSSEIQTSCESSVDAWSKETRWNSLLPSNSLLQTTQRSSLCNSATCCLVQKITSLCTGVYSTLLSMSILRLCFECIFLCWSYSSMKLQ
jgi:hypothetical protein